MLNEYQQGIILELQPLFEEAYDNGLWFVACSTVPETWLSPDELKIEQAKGNEIWKESHWELRHPEDRARQLDKAADRMNKAFEDFRKRM